MSSCYGRKLTEEQIESILETFKIKDGQLYRKWERGGKWKLIANKNNCNGYCLVGVLNKMMFYHRLVYILTNKQDVPVGYMIDHIDGDTLNNKIQNLRVVTNRENKQNCESHRLGRLVGCCFDKHAQKWKSEIRINNKKIHLGRFATEQEAHDEYQLALKYINDFVNPKQFRDLLKTKPKAGEMFMKILKPTPKAEPTRIQSTTDFLDQLERCMAVKEIVISKDYTDSIDFTEFMELFGEDILK